jgi:hypothetical protein
VLSSGEVEHDQFSFGRRTTQAASELLEEHRGLGGAEEEQRVDVGDVDAFVVNVDRTAPAPGRRRDRCERLVAPRSWCCRSPPGSKAAVGEAARDLFSVSTFTQKAMARISDRRPMHSVTARTARNTNVSAAPTSRPPVDRA